MDKQLKPGDLVSVCIKDNLIVYTYIIPDEIKTFEIISVDEFGVYLYVPHYYYLKGTFIISQSQCIGLNIKKVFLDESAIYVSENLIKNVMKIVEGISCSNCGEHHQYAEANMPDGTLLCYLCRFNKFR